MKNNYLVIMAGGVGSRFWPASTSSKPKQFLDMMGTGQTLLQHTVSRFSEICLIENILIVTSEQYVDLVKEQIPQLKPSNILAEPCMRNTAPCIAYATYKIRKQNPNANVIVSPADHLVLSKDIFQAEILKGVEFISENNAILTLGIQPHRPETGYGYIQTTDKDKTIAKVKAFKEKPELKIAEKYLQEGGYYWNAGIFLYKSSVMVDAFEKYGKDIANAFNKIHDKLGTNKEREAINEIYPKCENISIDYCVMEKADNLFVEKTTFSWSDLGTWTSLWERKQDKDENNNSSSATISKFYESSNTIVHTQTINKIAIQGLNNYIVVEANGVLLICAREEEQRIKQFVSDIEK